MRSKIKTWLKNDWPVYKIKWKKEKGLRKKATVLFLKFLGIMLLCTLISRSIYAHELAQVEVIKMQGRNLDHALKAEGSIVKKTEVAIPLLTGIRIKEVYVQKGERIEKDTPLLQIDMDDLEEQIQIQKIEIEKIRLKINELQYNQKIEEEKKATDIARAQEDAAISGTNAMKQVNEAKEEMEKAMDTQTALEAQEIYAVQTVDNDSQWKDYTTTIERLKRELDLLKEKRDSRTVSENEVGNVENEVELKKVELEAVKKNRDDYRSSALGKAREEWKKKKEEADDNAKTKTQEYANSLQAQEADRLKAVRALEDAHAKAQMDSSMQINQLDEKVKQKSLQKYLALQKDNGVIKSNFKGIITQINAVSGTTISEATNLIAANLDESLCFKAEINKEQRKYVEIGSHVMLQIDGSKRRYEGLLVEQIEESESIDKYNVLVSIPSDHVSIGKTGTLEIMQQSDYFDTCVPMDALHMENQQYYIYVIKNRNTVLGYECSVERRNVTVFDKNDKYVAIDSVITEEDQVITDSSKDIGEGDIVRIAE